MKRLHVHVAVENLAESRAFYSAMFGAEPNVVKSDYPKWLLDDPRVNFAISARGVKAGLDHLGIQVEDGQELAALSTQFAEADLSTFSEGETVCCYAKSDKTSLKVPSGVVSEAYHTMGEASLFNGGEETAPQSAEPQAAAKACCAPKAASSGGCC